jgi:hypothetical protein
MTCCETLRIGFLFVAVTLLLAACDGFLDEPAKGSLSGDVVENEKGVETLLIGAYSALTPTNGGTLAIAGGAAWTSDPAHWPYAAVASDVAQKGSVPNDQAELNPIQRNEFNATNSYFDGLWSNRYEGISRANGVLTALGNVENISEDKAARIRAEARFLRAYFYFDLKKNFDNVPLIADTTGDFNQPNAIEEEIIWPQIESDLQFAYDNLPAEQVDQARANKWAAASFLAKAYVYQEKWDQAKDLFDTIIDEGVTASGVSYALSDLYSQNFNAATQGGDNPEIIFSVEMTGDDGSGDIANSWAGYKLNYPHGVAPFRCCGFFLASHDLVNSFKTTEGGLPRPEGFTASFNDMDAVLKNDQGVSAKTKFTPPTSASLDPRLDWTVGRRGVPYHDHGPHPGKRYIRGPNSNYAGPYSMKKHVWRRSNQETTYNGNSWAPGTGVDYPAMRFADVLLMAAEAEIQSSSGSVQQALDYVNRVRERAATPAGFVDNSMNEAYATAVVEDESALLETDPSPFAWVVVTEENATYQYLGTGPASEISSWNRYPNPADEYNIEPYTMSAFQSDPGPLRRVHFERKLELAAEGHRSYDLQRWGRAEARMNEYYDYQGALTDDVNGASFTEGCFTFPIPQTQIDKSVVENEPRLTQNPGCSLY